MYAYEISDDGFIINNYLIDGGVPIPDGCVNVQLPQPLYYYKPRWSGEEWIEGASQDEIDEMTKVEPSPPTEMDLLKEQLQAQQIIIDELLFEVIPSLLPTEEEMI